VKLIRASLAISVVAVLLGGGCGPVGNPAVPYCPGPDRDAGGATVLIAQAVPSAAYAPCIANLPAGWSFGGERIRNERAEFWLDSDRAGYRAVSVSLTATCDISKAVNVPLETTERDVKRYEEPNSLPPRFFGNRYYVFPGGCVTYRFAFSRGGSFAQAVEATQALSFVSRAVGVRLLAQERIVLCGRGVSCPG
jgi:hypothetical protein